MLAETSAVLHADPFLCALPAACALVCVQARLYRGKGGELMRAAVCSLIGGSANARLGLSKRSFEGHLSTLDEALRHPSADVRAAAAASLPTFSRGDRGCMAPQCWQNARTTLLAQKLSAAGAL